MESPIKFNNVENPIKFNEFPVVNMLPELLKDKTTKQNIIFATSQYEGIDEKSQITAELCKSGTVLIEPRAVKSEDQQLARTRNKAEVFTPSWICNKMNNHCDTEWFGRENVFNVENEKELTWEPTTEPISFAKEKDWQKYVDSKRIEITCGEAPYIVSRYDATTAEIIPINRRIGILDRKMRVISENTSTEADWLKWVFRAYQSVYGYEFQGDNLLIARINLLCSFVDYMQARLNRVPTDHELKKITNIITWNLWQMDGITGTLPYGKPKETYHQISIFDYAVGLNDTEPEQIDCKIFDWRSNKSITYNSIRGGNV